MNSSFLLSLTTFIYGLAAFLYIAFWIFKKPLPGRLATWTALLGVIGNTVGIIMRWVESYRLGIGHAPLSNLYESLVFFAWTIAVVYLVIEKKYGNRIIGAFTTPLAFLAMAYASMSPNISDRIQPRRFCHRFWHELYVSFQTKGYRGQKQFARTLPEYQNIGRTEPSNDNVRVFIFDNRHHNRRGLGQFSLGPLLGLGSQGNLVPDYLVHLCDIAACPDDERLGWQTHCISFHHWIFCCALYIFRSELSAWFT